MNIDYSGIENKEDGANLCYNTSYLSALRIWFKHPEFDDVVMVDPQFTFTLAPILNPYRYQQSIQLRAGLTIERFVDEYLI